MTTLPPTPIIIAPHVCRSAPCGAEGRRPKAPNMQQHAHFTPNARFTYTPLPLTRGPTELWYVCVDTICANCRHYWHVVGMKWQYLRRGPAAPLPQKGPLKFLRVHMGIAVCSLFFLDIACLKQTLFADFRHCLHDVVARCQKWGKTPNASFHITKGLLTACAAQRMKTCCVRGPAQ